LTKHIPLKEKLESDKVALQALLEYAQGLQKLEYTGSSVLVSYYKRKLEEISHALEEALWHEENEELAK
jgi:hypothetical protein